MSNNSKAPPVAGRAAWYAVVILTVAYAISMVDRIILSLLVEPIQRDLNINDTQFGLLQGFAFVLLYATGGIPIARIADHWSRRWVISTGILVWSVMTGLCSVAQHYWQLLLFRVGVGVGEAALSPAGTSMLADLFPKQKLAKAIAIYASGGTIGTALAYIIGGYLLKVFPSETSVFLPILGEVRGWQMVFLVLAVPGIIVGLLALTMKEPQRRGSRELSASSPKAVIAFLRAHKRVIFLHFTGFSFLYVVTWGFVSWVPALMMRRYGMNVTDVGYILGILSFACGVSGGILGGVFTDWLVRRGVADAHMRVGLIAALFLAPTTIIAPMMGGPTACFVLLAGVLFLAHFWSAAATSGLQLFTPPHLRAQITAIYIMCVNLVGYGLGPVAIGLVTDHVFGDPKAVGYSMALVTAFSMPIVIVLLALARKPFAEAVRRFEEG
ncbi:MAG TPA: MFS transporter [Rhizomicrobium sp.]|nr:MFS transporter [Rhizomicrobium sp.]